MHIHYLFVFLLLCYRSLCQGNCVPTYTLDNLLQDQIIFEPQSQNGSIEETVPYFYPRSFFSDTPQVLASLDNYQVQNFSQMNYFLSYVVGRTNVSFTFISQHMQWKILRVKFWLTSRVDLLVGKFFLENINSNSQSTHQITIPSQFQNFIDQKTIHLNFITGLQAVSPTNTYEINVQNNGKSVNGTQFEINVKSNSDVFITKIQVAYAIFNFQSSYFASGGGQLTYTPLDGSRFKKIHSSFSPIIYLLYGFDKITLKAQKTFNLEFYFDQDWVMETFTGGKIDQLGVVYLSIGQQPAKVCDCDRYIQLDACVQQCPAFTYPYVNYAKGGKTCLTCSAKLNQTINEFNTGCDCLEGFERVDQVCLPKGPVTECLDKNEVSSNGQCVCIAGTQKVQGACVSICAANSSYDQALAQCVCDFGYNDIGGVCGVCPQDRIYNATFKACICPQNQFVNPTSNICQCIPTFYNFSNDCVKTCPNGYVIDGKNCIPVQECSTNETFVNGSCQCKQNTYRINGTCGVCPATTYHNATSQSCINCIANCATCFNFSSCAQCKNEYYYNSTSNQCLLNVSCNKVNETLQNGVCRCVQGTYRINGTCSVCPNQTYYNIQQQTCFQCVNNCISCVNGSSCSVCENGFQFDSRFGFCVPICGQNEQVVEGKCQCIMGTYLIEGSCQSCPSQHYYDPDLNQCLPCGEKCLECQSNDSCVRCESTYIFDPNLLRCVPTGCPENQTVVQGKCICIQGTYKIGQDCGVCGESEYYNATSFTCGKCPANCLLCTNRATCTQCAPHYKNVNSLCVFNLYDLKEGYPKFTPENIITDFVSNQEVTRQFTNNQLDDLLSLKFPQSENQPSQMIVLQKPDNLSQLRVIYFYCTPLPFKEFTVDYVFFNQTADPIRNQTQLVKYNLISQGYTGYEELQ